MVFDPTFVKAMPDDTVHFVPTRGQMGKEFTLKVTTPRRYGVKCLPHYSMGMVALVQVGKDVPAERAAAKAVKVPPCANKRMAPMLTGVK